MNLENLRCFNPLTGKRDGDYCTWEGEGKCLKCQLADHIEELKLFPTELQSQLNQAQTIIADQNIRIKELEAVIADVRKLPDEWEEQDAQAQWPADVPNGSQCADDLRAAIKRGENSGN
jgi:hypothetical protein